LDVETVKIADPVPPDVRVTLFGLRAVVGACDVAGEILDDKVTVPAKPLILVNVIVDVA
jgi:hypothetical protein